MASYGGRIGGLIAMREVCPCARGVGVIAAVLFLALSPPAVWSEADSPGGDAAGAEVAPNPIEMESIEARLAEAAQERVAAEAALAQADDDQARAHAADVVDRLRDIEALLRQQQQERRAVAEISLPAVDDADGQPSVFRLNDLLEAQYDQGRAVRQRKQRLEAGRRALAGAKEELQDATKQRRAAARDFDDEPTADARRLIELRQLDERSAQEAVHLRMIQVRELDVEVTDPPDARASEIAELRHSLATGAGDAAEGFAELARREGELRTQLGASKRSLATADLVLEAARARFSRGPDPSGDVLAEAEARAGARDAIRQTMLVLEARIERAKTTEEIWRQWSAALAGPVAREQLESWMDSTEARLEALALDEIQREGRLDELERLRTTLRDQLDGTPPGTSLERARRDQLAAVTDLLEAEREDRAALASERRLTERYLEDLEDQTGHVDVSEFVDDGVEALVDFWEYEITAVEDSAITVGSLVLALLLAGLGFWGSRRASAFVGRFAKRRFRLDSGAAHALETLTFYVLFVSLTVFVLRIVHFPLTVFTVLGGALAIGVGFGSQNVMNNFISGLILMFERPVRAGDLVEVEGNYGTVEAIGARSTRIRSTDGRHIIVPNSFFLENNLVNWTLSDELVRARVVVGVIYGSPTRLVEKRIRQAVDEEPGVLKTPEPIIIFEEFGDNSLNFDVHFWVKGRSPMAMKQIQSRIRFRIDDLFREDGLVIAFPQRDVHLDTASPLQVEFVGRRGTKEDE